MKKKFTAILLLFSVFNIANATQCINRLDTYASYNEVIKNEEINNIPSEYYVLSYTWAPGHCARVPSKNKKPGKKDYLQCGRGAHFGYILHGLWPQGALDKKGGYPRACEGDQEKIDKRILDKFLCMTPSVWLLQHEYEYHGTCMHDERLETPEKYFSTAMKLHLQLKLPMTQLRYNETSINWFIENNPQLTRESIQYYKNGREWQFCYDNDFNVMSCPGHSNEIEADVNSDCNVKGNISNRSGNKYYFVASHPNYSEVVITPSRGEMCFASEQAAINAGWFKAPQ